MIREELNQLKSGPKELRKFGLTVGAVFLLLAGWLCWRHRPAGPYLLIPGAPLVVLGLAYPRCLRWVYLAWMTAAFVMGALVSTVLLTVFFYLIFTPVGWLARSLGRDFLHRKWEPQAKSYWLARDPSTPKQRSDLERQF
ncbi:MAG: SxtJ family membrane protein [Limisphaerales bacterium]